jgi:prophage regulatory protein
MRVLRKPAVIERVGYSGMHIDRLEKAGKFPKRIRLGENAVGWLADEVEAWIQERVDARDSASEAAA